MKAIDGIVPGDDEDFLSVLYPAKIGRSNCVNGNAVISHFAFFTQREYLDKQHILERYGEILHRQWQADPKMKAIDDTIQQIMADISANEAELMSRPSPYKKYGGVVEKPTLKHCIATHAKNYCPPALWSYLKKRYGKAKDVLIMS